MNTWFLLALGSALTNSLVQAFFNHVVSLKKYSKTAAVFGYSLIASSILFSISLIAGIPHLDTTFWWAVIATAAINSFTGPIILRAYELGEFSSVYSMILLTPVFSLFIAAVSLGELPGLGGVAGVLFTVFGLYLISKKNDGADEKNFPDFKKGNLLGMFVAFCWAISTIFDKLATVHSNPIFAPAVGLFFIASMNGLYALWNREKTENNSWGWLGGIFLLLPLGMLFALSNVLHNAALSYGFVAYTLAIKRTGVLLGVLWGWLFFRERNIAKKLLGAAIAVGGVVMILFS